MNGPLTGLTLAWPPVARVPIESRGARPVVEGAATAPVARALAEELGVDMPITAAIAAIIEGEIDIDTAIDRLMRRPLKLETE